MEQRKQPFILAQQFHCCNNNTSMFICTNEHCQYSAFMCSDLQCECISKKHFQCNSNNCQYILVNIQKQRKEITENNQLAINSIVQKYDQMIETLSNDKAYFIDSIDMFGLRDNTRKFVSLINEGKSKQITGDLAYKTKLEISSMNTDKSILDDLKYIQKRWKEQKKQFQSICFEIKRYKDIKMKKIDSQILNQEGQDQIINWLEKGPVQFQLLYRGSQNQFSSSLFHKKCDGIPDTLVLIQTQFGKVLGGYTPVQWQQSNHDKFLPDHSGKSFVFSLDLNKKFPIKDKYKAIRMCPNYGPMFGSFSCLYVYNECNKRNNNSGVYPNEVYDFGNLSTNQNSYRELSGQENGYNFTVKEYQVFKVKNL